MASRIATRLPLHLQRPSPLLNNAAAASSSSLSSSNAHIGNKRRLPGQQQSNNSGLLSFNNRTTFTCANKFESLRQDYNHQPSTTTAEFHTSHQAPFRTHSPNNEESSYLSSSNSSQQEEEEQIPQPGSIAFGECEISALSDLFLQFAKTKDSVNGGTPYLTPKRIKLLLESVGEKPDDTTLQSLMEEINLHKDDGRLRLDCFLRAADRILGRSPARIVLVVGGPGSGKGALCERLAQECGAVHLSCGEMLREEVEASTPLGREVAAIMSRGDLVSSAVVTALMRRRMRQHPGRRILLDGFPRSLENARDFVELCGPPELALHLDCDDTILIERILARGGKSAKEAERAASSSEGNTAPVESVREDDNVHTALRRLKNYHKHHQPTMNWLREQRVPIVELDCSGSKEDVWGSLAAIGRLMRPAVKLPQSQQQQQKSQSQHAQQHHHGGMAVNGNVTAAAPPLPQQNAINGDMQWIA